jgi:hypothetical protein
VSASLIEPRLPVMLLIAVIVVIILMALFGYLTGRWQVNDDLSCSAMTILA